MCFSALRLKKKLNEERLVCCKTDSQPLEISSEDKKYEDKFYGSTKTVVSMKAWIIPYKKLSRGSFYSENQVVNGCIGTNIKVASGLLCHNATTH